MWLGRGAAGLGLTSSIRSTDDALVHHLLRDSGTTITFCTRSDSDQAGAALEPETRWAHKRALTAIVEFMEDHVLQHNIIVVANTIEHSERVTTDLRIGLDVFDGFGNVGPLDVELLARSEELLVALHAMHAQAIYASYRTHRADQHDMIPEDRATDALFEFLAGPTGVTRESPTFRRNDVIAALADHTPVGMMIPEALATADAFLAAEGICLTGSPTAREARFTTNEMLACELRVVTTAVDGQSAGRAAVDPAIVRTVLDQLTKRNGARTFSHERRSALEHITTSGAAVDVLIGAAGAGKTKLMAAAHDVWGAHGTPIVGTAPTPLALSRLVDKSGIRALPIDALVDPAASPLPYDGVVIVDEAGAIGTRALDRLFAIAHARSTKVVLIGDPHQLAADEASGVLSALADRLDHVPTIMTTRRQEKAWERAALLELRSGDVTAAIDAYLQHDRIVAGSNPERTRELAIEEWMHRQLEVVGASAFSPERAVMLIAYGEPRVQHLVTLARDALRATGRLHGPDVHHASGPNGFAVGDHVITRFNAEYLNLSEGTAARVVRIDEAARSLTIEFMAGNTLNECEIATGYLDRGEIVHAYALDVREVQSRKVAEAIYVAGPQANREEAYSALSRGIKRNMVFVETDTPTALDTPAVSALALIRRLQQSRAPRMALDVLHETFHPVVAELPTLQRIADRRQAVEERIAQWSATLEATDIANEERAAIEGHLTQARRNHATLQKRLSEIKKLGDKTAGLIARGGIHTVTRAFSEFAELDPMLSQQYGRLAEQYAAASSGISAEEIIADHVQIDVGEGIIFEADFIVRHPAGVYIKEVKAGKGSRTRAQKLGHPLVAEHGGRVLSGNFHNQAALRVGDELPPTPVVREIWR
jgi:hypothetical protein